MSGKNLTGSEKLMEAVYEVAMPCESKRKSNYKKLSNNRCTMDTAHYHYEIRLQDVYHATLDVIWKPTQQVSSHRDYYMKGNTLVNIAEEKLTKSPSPFSASEWLAEMNKHLSVPMGTLVK